METVRKPFQGIKNIVRFNWHFYVIAIGLLVLLSIGDHHLKEPYHIGTYIFIILIAVSTVISLAVSLYVYDLSGLYQLNWLNACAITSESKIININAGFDETSALLKQKYPDASLTVYDFYDPAKHTEISIKRARKAYPQFEGTEKIDTSALPATSNYADYILLIFSAHEIRNAEERIMFFNQLKRVLKPGGKIVLLEHLRDMPNFLAYNIGFFHFMPKASWYHTFRSAGLQVSTTVKVNPFVTCFIIEK